MDYRQAKSEALAELAEFAVERAEATESGDTVDNDDTPANQARRARAYRELATELSARSIGRRSWRGGRHARR